MIKQLNTPTDKHREDKIQKERRRILAIVDLATMAGESISGDLVKKAIADGTSERNFVARLIEIELFQGR